MAKYHGKVGFVHTKQTRPGVTVEVADERIYNGDILRSQKRWEQSSTQLNENLTLSNQFSIVADPYAYDNFFAIRYIWYMGARWKVTNVEIARPRLLLTVGGVYNGPNAVETTTSK